jgi:hypothetical protein
MTPAEIEEAAPYVGRIYKNIYMEQAAESQLERWQVCA